MAYQKRGLEVKFSKIYISKIYKFPKVPKINPSESVWVWHLFFVQGFIKTYYLKTKMCCWEQKQGSVELVDFQISNSDAQWWLLESWHLSTLSTKLFSSQFKKKPGISCIALCRSTWHSWLQQSSHTGKKISFVFLRVFWSQPST